MRKIAVRLPVLSRNDGEPMKTMNSRHLFAKPLVPVGTFPPDEWLVWVRKGGAHPGTPPKNDRGLGIRPTRANRQHRESKFLMTVEDPSPGGEQV